MDKDIKTIAVISVLFVALLSISACGKMASQSSGAGPAKALSGNTQWKYDRVVSRPIEVTGGASAVKLGDLKRDSISVMIPAKSLAKDTKISLVTPKSVPGYPGAEMTPLGAPVDISGEGVNRLDGKVTVTMKFDPKSLGKTADASRLRFVYHSGEKWDYVKPEAVDMKDGSATFGMYHFSLVGLTKIKDETKLTEEWIHSQALDKTLRDNINKESDYVAKQIIEQTLEKMGVKDKSVTQKITTDMLVSDGDKIREMYESAKKGEKETAFQKMVVFLGTGISRTLPEGALQDAINGIDENVDDIAAVPKALAYALEGQHKEAAKIIGEAIADKFLITTAGKIAVEVAEHQINSWKNSEVEAAYEAYKNGSDAKFWGYNNDAGDFETVWNQMRGISRQLELETVEKERKIREESGMPPLTPEREAIIREGVKQSYQRQFKERLDQEKVIKKEEDKLNTLMGAFEDANLLDRALGPVGLDRGFTFEQKLDLLHNFAEKMMRDTGRPDFKDVKGLRPDKALRLDDLVTGAKIYFGKDGKQKYLEHLEKEFDIVLDGARDGAGIVLTYSPTDKRYPLPADADMLSAPILVEKSDSKTLWPAKMKEGRIHDEDYFLKKTKGLYSSRMKLTSRFEGNYDSKTGTLKGILSLSFKETKPPYESPGPEGPVMMSRENNYFMSAELTAKRIPGTRKLEGKASGKSDYTSTTHRDGDSSTDNQPSIIIDWQVSGQLPEGL